jgi:hypothetical protein
MRCSWARRRLVEPFQLIDVEPVGERTSDALVCGGGRCRVMTTRSPVYPASENAEALRRLRLSRNLSLRRAAALLAMSGADLSALEWGRKMLTSPEEWARALKALESAKTS